MRKLALLSILLFSFVFSFSQQNILFLKKGKKTIQKFWKGSSIAFRLANKEWQKGEITRIQNDSFYIRPVVIRYGMYGSDTLRYNAVGFSFSDVYAFPKKGVLVDYKNGQYQIITSAGHQHFYWIKSGWIFRTGAIGYTGLYVINGLLKNDLSIAKSKTSLVTAAGIYLGGFLMKLLYRRTLRLGKKYHIEMFQITQRQNCLQLIDLV
jgi:hypothetical protein